MSSNVFSVIYGSFVCLPYWTYLFVFFSAACHLKLTNNQEAISCCKEVSHLCARTNKCSHNATGCMGACIEHTYCCPSCGVYEVLSEQWWSFSYFTQPMKYLPSQVVSVVGLRLSGCVNGCSATVELVQWLVWDCRVVSVVGLRMSVVSVVCLRMSVFDMGL